MSKPEDISQDVWDDAVKAVTPPWGGSAERMERHHHSLIESIARNTMKAVRAKNPGSLPEGVTQEAFERAQGCWIDLSVNADDRDEETACIARAIDAATASARSNFLTMQGAAASLLKRAEAAEANAAALEAKLASIETCACSYDAPDEICLHHSTALLAVTEALKKATRSVDPLQCNPWLGEALEAIAKAEGRQL